jgi:hypothetical protein
VIRGRDVWIVRTTRVFRTGAEAEAGVY